MARAGGNGSRTHNAFTALVHNFVVKLHKSQVELRDNGILVVAWVAGESALRVRNVSRQVVFISHVLADRF